MSMTLTVDAYIVDPYDDQTAQPWRIEWHYGSKTATVQCLQPPCEWPVDVDISPFAPIAGVKNTLELMLRNFAGELVA